MHGDDTGAACYQSWTNVSAKIDLLPPWRNPDHAPWPALVRGRCTRSAVRRGRWPDADQDLGGTDLADLRAAARRHGHDSGCALLIEPGFVELRPRISPIPVLAPGERRPGAAAPTAGGQL